MNFDDAAKNETSLETEFDHLLHDIHGGKNAEELANDFEALGQKGHAEAYCQLARLHLDRVLPNRSKTEGIEALGNALELADHGSNTADRALEILSEIKERIVNRDEIRAGKKADLVDVTYANQKEEQDATIKSMINDILTKFDQKVNQSAEVSNNFDIDS